MTRIAKFPTSWIEVVFDDAVEVISDRGARIQQKAYLPEGLLPVIDQGEGLIGGYTNDLASQVASSKPVIVFGDHTRRFKFVKFPFAVGADGVKLLSPSALWCPEFLYLQLGTIDLENRGYGRHYQHLRRALLVLPPQAEQTRIVAKLEEVLSDLDAGVAELEAARKKLARYRQSLLKAAVEGTLTADWRAERARRGDTFETGPQLLERILRERRAHWEEKQRAKFAEKTKSPPMDWRSEYVEPAGPQDTPGNDVPAGWGLATLDQLLDMLSSGSRDWSAYYGRGSSIFVMAQNVRPWRPDFSFRQAVDPPPDHRDRVRSAIAKDDLLITIVGANTGQVCRVPEPLQEHFVCQSVALLRLVEPAMAEFVNAVLNSPSHGQRQFREMNYGAGRPHLSFEQVGSVLVPLPPMAEQEVILERLTSAMEATADVEAQIQSVAKGLAAQRQNILRAAFSGRLVPQDPADEPASALLARIRAERTNGESTTKKPRGRRKASEAA